MLPLPPRVSDHLPLSVSSKAGRPRPSWRDRDARGHLANHVGPAMRGDTRVAVVHVDLDGESTRRGRRPPHQAGAAHRDPDRRGVAGVDRVGQRIADHSAGVRRIGRGDLVLRQ